MFGELTVTVHADAARRKEAISVLNKQGYESLDLQGCTLSWRDINHVITMDGRCLGWRTGVLFNLQERRQALVERGVAESNLSGDLVCAESIGQRGLDGLKTLRFHGVIAVVHRAQDMVMLSSDPVGVGTLWTRQIEGCQVWSTSLPDSNESNAYWSPVGASTAIMIQRGMWRDNLVEFDDGPFVRHRPDAWVYATVEQAEHLVKTALDEAVKGWTADRGPIAACAHPGLNDISANSTGARWDPAGFASLAERSPWPEPWQGLQASERTEALQRWCAERFGPKWLPPEPEARVPEPRRSERWLRYSWWMLDNIQPIIEAAIKRNQRVGLPHLDPAVLALCSGLSAELILSMKRFEASRL
ncbi:MAG TPA: hypothetical protein DCQ06_08025 [Myxococcales bacterium]|nr:hypothetical protein [Myxococcales bacterium]HAN31531.1 hypothetical protein [Myxococcales bacterium]